MDRVITTQYGKVRGEVSDRIGYRFLGIPFAAPPIGPLRWIAPQEPLKWDGILEATRYPNAPIQEDVAKNSILSQFSFANPPESNTSEDCLYLNIWTPDLESCDPSSKLPVIFWIYGGGHRCGSASHPCSRGDKLAAKGCIVVAANYRLGALGYLTHPLLASNSNRLNSYSGETSGNYASLDIIKALEWVQENITNFGGDSENVTLLGQSAGAAHIDYLISSKLAKGLFHKAIPASGGRMDGGLIGNNPSREDAEKAGLKLMQNFNAESLEAMQALSTDQLRSIHSRWTLHTDGYVVNQSPQQAYDKSDVNKVPLYVGFTGHDSAPYPEPSWQTVEGFNARVAEFSDQEEALKAFYHVATDKDAKLQSYRLRRDLTFAYQAWRHLRAMAEQGENTWLYYFDKAPNLPLDNEFSAPRPLDGFGAFHGADLWYSFDNLDLMPWETTEEDEVIAKNFSDSIVSFAKYGNPCANGTKNFKPYAQNDKNPLALTFKGDMSIESLPNSIALLSLEEFYLSKKRRD